MITINSQVEDRFWILWDPSSHNPPGRRHASRDDAKIEAERLLASGKCHSIFILCATGVYRAPMPRPTGTYTKLENKKRYRA